MKALILNSGTGTRLQEQTKLIPKCLLTLGNGETILSRQIQQLSQMGIEEVVITTGEFHHMIQDACENIQNISFTFVKNPLFQSTNYIYSILCAKEHLHDDILLLHGDLVMDDAVLKELMAEKDSAMVVSTTLPLPEKDFKAVVKEGRIEEIGISCFQNALAAQPCYKLDRGIWFPWLEEMEKFCQEGNVTCYAENALNQILSQYPLGILDIGDTFCSEVDIHEDLEYVRNILNP